MAACFGMVAVVALPAQLAAQSQPTQVLERSGTAPAGDVAIVIGIQSYEHVPDLTNTVRDAQAVSTMLTSFGYTVFEGYDIDKREFETLLRQAALNIRTGSQVFFYYAGHGIQLGRRNYLLTRDAAFTDIHDLPFQSVTLDHVSAILGGKAGSQILMLDSCRDNPVPDAKLTADIGVELFEAREGFDVFRPPLNTLVAFSTSPGATALDGDPGSNSPYTAAVVRQFPARPGEDAMTVLSAVRGEVYTLTNNQQVTWESSTLTEKLFVSPRGQTVQIPAREQPPAQPDLPDSLTISAALGRSLELAPQISPYLAPGTDLSITNRPVEGVSTLTYDTQGQLSLNYVPRLAETSSLLDRAGSRKDQMVLRLAQGDTSRDLTVTVEMEPNACDVQAGDLLDLQGVGLFRFPNEINLKEADSACRAAVASAPTVGRFHYQLGRALQGQGHLTEAFDAFVTATDLGHIRAYNAMAYLLETPNIDRDTVQIPLDLRSATALWEKGVEAGDPFSMHARGKRLLHSADAEDRKHGFELLSRALELGHTYSMNELGVFYLWDQTGLAQPTRGLSYLQASADRGDIYGMANLGYVYRDGAADQPVDMTRARDLFARASDLGHPTAPAEIARMIMQRKLPGSDAAEALQWNDIGLQRGDAWAGANGAWIARNRLDNRLPAHAAAVRAGKALALGNPDASRAATEVLNTLDNAQIDRATQSILRDLGATLTVDGQFGRASRAALQQLAEQVGLPLANDLSPISRLQLAGQIHFALNPIRQDLF